MPIDFDHRDQVPLRLPRLRGPRVLDGKSDGENESREIQVSLALPSQGGTVRHTPLWDFRAFAGPVLPRITGR